MLKLIPESRANIMGVKTKNNVDILTKAINFALAHHGDAMHGSSTYSEHLSSVATKVAEYDASPEAGAISYLHDVIEDTDVTKEDIEKEFTPEIAHDVDLLTDREGADRLERHLKTYHRIRTSRRAVLVKCGDRFSNHAKSIKENSPHFLQMYVNEYLYFKFAFYEPGMHDKLWRELDEQHELMKFMLKHQRS